MSRDLAELIEFLTKTMSMTEVYQPVVILRLLERGEPRAKRIWLRHSAATTGRSRTITKGF